MDDFNKKLISIIVPFYNEEAAVLLFYDAICKEINTVLSVEFEIICVDDGSEDETLKHLIGLAKKDSRFHVIELSRNFGKESALTAGIDVAIGDALIPIDADLQDPPSLIPKMINEWLNGAEVVLARRSDRYSDSLFKRKTAKAFYYVHNKIADITLPDNVGDFRLIDRVVVEAIKKLPEKQRFMKGLFAWVGFKSVTLEYSRSSRVSGKTKYSIWKLITFAVEGITGFTSLPLRLWLYVGFVLALITACILFFIVFKFLIFQVQLTSHSILFVLILMFGSLQLISVGMLGEYVGRIYMETKNRPSYIIRKIYNK